MAHTDFMQQRYSRSQIAELTGFSKETIRYYEDIGLLQPEHDEKNYREYTDSDIKRLKLVS